MTDQAPASKPRPVPPLPPYPPLSQYGVAILEELHRQIVSGEYVDRESAAALKTPPPPLKRVDLGSVVIYQLDENHPANRRKRKP